MAISSYLAFNAIARENMAILKKIWQEIPSFYFSRAFCAFKVSQRRNYSTGSIKVVQMRYLMETFVRKGYFVKRPPDIKNCYATYQKCWTTRYHKIDTVLVTGQYGFTCIYTQKSCTQHSTFSLVVFFYFCFNDLKIVDMYQLFTSSDVLEWTLIPMAFLKL